MALLLLAQFNIANPFLPHLFVMHLLIKMVLSSKFESLGLTHSQTKKQQMRSLIIRIEKMEVFEY